MISALLSAICISMYPFKVSVTHYCGVHSYSFGDRFDLLATITLVSDLQIPLSTTRTLVQISHQSSLTNPPPTFALSRVRPYRLGPALRQPGRHRHGEAIDGDSSPGSSDLTGLWASYTASVIGS